MRYKVPQNIDLEDKVIGPLTLKQFIYILSGGMADYIIYKSFEHWIGWILIFAATGIALAFAFVKIQEQDFAYFLSAFFSFLLSPKIFMWNKEVQVEEIPKISKPSASEKEDALTKDPEKVRSRLQVLAEIVDTQGWGQQEIGNRVSSTKEPERRLAKIEEKKEGVADPLEDVEPSVVK